MLSVTVERVSMACRFEVRLLGDDERHLRAVGEAALREVSRLERLLSRFDPRSEIARVNRDAFSAGVLVDRELLEILVDCGERERATDGFFDAATHPGDDAGVRRAGFLESVSVDEIRRRVRFLRRVVLDLGGYGKGLAVDRAARVVESFGVRVFRINAGTSSLLARGRETWRVAIRDPFRDGEAACEPFHLDGRGLSSSGCGASEALDDSPRAACSVLANTALDAEVLSTALLAMGRARAQRFLRRRGEASELSVAWIDSTHSGTRFEWLSGEPSVEAVR